MAINGTTPSARIRSTYLGRALDRERSAVDICRYRFGVVLLDLQRELAKAVRDEERIVSLIYDAMEAESMLSLAKADLEEAEEV